MRIFPLDHPGLDPPGPDLVRMLRSKSAIDLASRLEIKKKAKDALLSTAQIFQISEELEFEIRNLIEDILTGECTNLTLRYKNNFVPCRCLAGHRWVADELGPIPSDVMLVNKLSYNDDIEAGASLMGETSMVFYNHLCDKGLDPSDWYVTNFVKTQHPEWDLKSTTLTAGMLTEFKPILQQEILLVRPKIILCLGTEALSAVLGKKVTMAASTNVVYRVPLCFHRVETTEVVVIGIPHPHSVLRKGDTGALDDLNAHIDFFIEQLNCVLGNREIIHYKEEGLDHRVIISLREWEDTVAEIEETCEDNLIAVDAEWNGSHPQNANGYLRCFQISWGHKKAACLALAPQTEDCELARLCYYKGKELDRLLAVTKQAVTGKRIAGHFIEADLEFLIPFGLDLRENFAVPDSWEAYQRAWNHGKPCGFDTGRAIHAISETADLSLKAQAREHTEARRYDKELDDWIAANTVKTGKGDLHKKKLDGFGIIPDAQLFAYANYDADVTRRLAVLYTEMLDSDAFGNNCWKPFWLAMRALSAIVEINCTGLHFNWERLEELTQQYTEKAEKLIQEVRDWARWPDFNPRSAFQMRELLFGEEHNRKTMSKAEIQKLPPGTVPPEFIRIRPLSAKSMKLEPIFTTGKYPRKWDEVVRSGRSHLATPSTNKHTIAQLLFFQHTRAVVDTEGRERILNFKSTLEKLRNWNTVSQTLRYVLKPPVKDEDTGELVYDDEGDLLYDAGIPSCVCDDDKVRTHIWPTKATGRWSSAWPSLQNLGKGVEKLLKDIFQEEYKYPLRSLFRAAKGCYFVEADYVGAEIANAAFMCNDVQMLDHVRRNQLPEDNPDHYDIHSHIAVSTFKLDCTPSKTGLAEIGKAHLRDISKQTIFGLFYGRSPRAIAEGARSQGYVVSEQEALAVVEQVRALYPSLLPFFNQCADRITTHRWLANAFGRYRRFPEPIDEEQRKRFERQAKNFPIQGMVADVVNQAVYHILRLRDEWKLKAKLVLQIHDAIILEVPEEEVKIVYEKLLPQGMVAAVPIVSTDLNGVAAKNSTPHYLGLDINVCKEWGTSIKDLSVFGIKQ